VSHGGADADAATAVAIDRLGNVVMVGYFSDRIDFGGGELVSAGLGDVFVAKFAPDSTHVWSKRFGGALFDSAQAVVLRADQSIVVTGHFRDSLRVGETVLASTGDRDVFLIDLTAAGDVVAARALGGNGADTSSGLAVNNAGDVYVGGSFSEEIDVGYGPLESVGAGDAFVAKFRESLQGP